VVCCVFSVMCCVCVWCVVCVVCFVCVVCCVCGVLRVCCVTCVVCEVWCVVANEVYCAEAGLCESQNLMVKKKSKMTVSRGMYITT
jgi:hypothetical protein